MIKNILNYTKNLICFAVSSLLLLSSSYAMTFDTNTIYSPVNGHSNSIPNSTVSTIGGVSYNTLNTYLYDYLDNGSQASFNSLVSTMSGVGYSQYIYYKYTSGNNNMDYCIFLPENAEIGIGYSSDNEPYAIFIDSDFYFFRANNNLPLFYNTTLYSGYYSVQFLPYYENGYNWGYSLDYSVPQLYYYEYEDKYKWDGTSYFYVPSPTPSYIPTNKEIADKVQAFYNSDLFQNQSDFKDYFVLYNYNNETFSFIGHNLVGTITDTNVTHDNMSLLGQVIYSADYPTNNVGQTYWSFRFETDWSNIVNFFNGNKYYLFSTTLNSESISYTGIGSISDLVQLKFDPTYSTIVYSTKDYMVTIFDNPSPPDPDYGTSDIISGDLYTYDENIDPTTSEYNPITNYVLPNSVDTLISNADIPGLLQIWVTPDFSNMDWVFACISAFWGYFGGFVLLTAIMFFIMWLLRG